MSTDFVRIMFYDAQKKAWVVEVIEASEILSQETPAQSDEGDAPGREAGNENFA